MYCACLLFPKESITVIKSQQFSNFCIQQQQMCLLQAQISGCGICFSMLCTTIIILSFALYSSSPGPRWSLSSPSSGVVIIDIVLQVQVKVAQQEQVKVMMIPFHTPSLKSSLFKQSPSQFYLPLILQA